MKRRLEQFYAEFGDRGIMFILYAFSLVVNSLLTWNMELPAVYPDEIAVAGTAAYYTGRNWTALTGQVGSGGGYVQALFYAPLYMVFNNPFALYKAMLVMNAILISFIPMIVYHLAAKLGVTRVRQKLLIAVSCGMYISYITDSKFIWNETVTSVLCWLLALCVFTAWDKKNRGARFTTSVLLGFLCALAYAANVRLIALVIALILTVVLAQTVFKERIVNLPVFAVSIALSFLAEHLLCGSLANRLWKNATIPLDVSYKGSFFGEFFSHLYTFMTSTLGMGALAAALSAVMIYSCIKEGIRRRVDTPESNTKVYEPIKHKYSLRLTLFALFQFLAVGCTTIYSAWFGVEKAAGSSILFERYADNLAPFSMFLVLVFIMLYGIDLGKLLFGAGIYAYACLCFAAVGYPLVSRTETVRGAVVGMLPVSLGEGVVDDIPGMTYIIMSSCVFTMFMLLVVFVSCSRKRRTALVTVSVFSLIVITTGYFGAVYLPLEGIENSRAKEPYRAVRDLLYNAPQSPPIVVYETDPALAATIQFLAPDTKVSIARAGEKIPESCLLIAENGVSVPFEGSSYDSVGKTSEYSVYAFGESARNFMKYSEESKRETAKGSQSSNY